jgi:LmbE family N-acetylglucosaminyl deacetylase
MACPLVLASSPAAASDAHVETALLVLAHPDDETMMGGALGRLRERGVRVHVIYATRGEGGKMMVHEGGDWIPAVAQDPTQLGQRREHELKRALTWFGAKSYLPLAQPDEARRGPDRRPTRDPHPFLEDGVWDVGALRAEIRAFAERVQPDIVFTLLPDNHAVHAHHQAIGTLTRDLFERRELGKKAQQVYGIEERAWYAPDVFAGDEARKIHFDTRAIAPKLGMGYDAFADVGARQHATQEAGHRPVAEDEVFVPLSSARADPLRALLTVPPSKPPALGSVKVDALRRLALRARWLGPGPVKVEPIARARPSTPAHVPVAPPVAPLVHPTPAPYK